MPKCAEIIAVDPRYNMYTGSVTPIRVQYALGVVEYAMPSLVIGEAARQ